MKILATSDLHGCAMAAKMLQAIDQISGACPVQSR